MAESTDGSTTTKDAPKRRVSNSDSGRDRRWLPWLVGTIAIGLFVMPFKSSARNYVHEEKEADPAQAAD